MFLLLKISSFYHEEIMTDYNIDLSPLKNLKKLTSL